MSYRLTESGGYRGYELGTNLHALESYSTAAAYTDAFPYSNGRLATVSSAWTGGITGMTVPLVVSNHVELQGGEPNGAVLYNATFAVDQYVQADVVAPAACNPGVICRAHSNSDFVWLELADTTNLQLYYHVGGGYSFVAEISVGSTSGTIRLEAQGTTFRAYFGGVLKMTETISATEVQTGVPGIFMFNGGTMDNWAGGDL